MIFLPGKQKLNDFLKEQKNQNKTKSIIITIIIAVVMINLEKNPYHTKKKFLKSQNIFFGKQKKMIDDKRQIMMMLMFLINEIKNGQQRKYLKRNEEK